MSNIFITWIKYFKGIDYFAFTNISPTKRISWYFVMTLKMIENLALNLLLTVYQTSLYIWGSWFILICLLDITNAVLSLSHFNFCYIKLSFAFFVSFFKVELVRNVYFDRDLLFRWTIKSKMNNHSFEHFFWRKIYFNQHVHLI